MTFFSDFCLVCVKKNIPRNDFFVGHGPWKSKSTFFFSLKGSLYSKDEMLF